MPTVVAGKPRMGLMVVMVVHTIVQRQRIVVVMVVMVVVCHIVRARAARDRNCSAAAVEAVTTHEAGKTVERSGSETDDHHDACDHSREEDVEDLF